MIRIDGLPEEPLAAAGLFHQHWLAHVEEKLGEGDVMVALDPADHRHRDWRRAIARDLARKNAPRRINLVAGDDAVFAAFAAYLAGAPGITGQYLEGDGQGAGDPAR
ncbi:Rossmann fold domain-containing protein [Qipengyuania sp. MTN3-11]|uniref:Rossmann fold domain-containing protein n=1 Tax=Qipengyuania sp. MTN3-11 TaxID=3056557 RepID=UPI0036F23411